MPGAQLSSTRPLRLAYESGPDAVDLGAIIDGRLYHRPDVTDPGGVAEREAGWAADRAQAGPQPPVELYGTRGPRTTEVDRRIVPLGELGRAALERALAADYRTLSRELGLLTLAAMSTAMTVHRLDGRPIRRRRAAGPPSVVEGVEACRRTTDGAVPAGA